MNRTEIAFALSFVVHNISLIESSVILLTYFFSACRNAHKTLWMRGWLANFLRTVIPSIHRICQKTADEIIYVHVCVCECTNMPGRVEKRDVLWQIYVCQLANLDFTINVMVHCTEAFSKHQLCYTHARVCAHTRTHAHTHIFFYMCIYIYRLTSVKPVCHIQWITETMEWAESLLTQLAKHFSVIIDLSNICFCVFKRENRHDLTGFG